MKDPSGRPAGFARRELLGGAALLVAAGAVPIGCSGGAAAALKAGQVAVPSGDLAGGRRVTVMVGSNPVEVFRDESGVTARLLRCTHSGCVVKWNAESRRYLCPCHDGRFDENGAAVAGPPPAPLRRLPVAVERNRIVVG